MVVVVRVKSTIMGAIESDLNVSGMRSLSRPVRSVTHSLDNDNDSDSDDNSDGDSNIKGLSMHQII